jgi:hypothetical protein
VGSCDLVDRPLFGEANGSGNGVEGRKATGDGPGDLCLVSQSGWSPEIPFPRHSETGSEAQDRRRGAQCGDPGNERWQLKGSPCRAAPPLRQADPEVDLQYYVSDPGSGGTLSSFEFLKGTRPTSG